MRTRPARDRPAAASRPTNPAPRWRRWWLSRGPVIGYATRFGALLGAGYGVLLVPCVDRGFYAYLCANAWVSSALLNACGQPTHAVGLEIRAGQFGIAVRRGCDAVEPSWFLCAAVLAFPAPWRRKLVGMLAGVALISVLNLARIVSLYFVGRYWPRVFAVAHLELWPAAFIIVTVLFWLGWLYWARGVGVPEHGSA